MLVPLTTATEPRKAWAAATPAMAAHVPAISNRHGSFFQRFCPALRSRLICAPLWHCIFLAVSEAPSLLFWHWVTITHPMSGPFAQPIDASTRYCAVYGHPVKHSASPAMQNAGLAALSLNWRYLAFEVHPDDLRAALAGAQGMNFIGINLTLPHKLLAV